MQVQRALVPLRSPVQDSRTGSRRQAPRKDNRSMATLLASQPVRVGVHRRRRRDGLSPPARASGSTRGPGWSRSATPIPALLEKRKAEWGVDAGDDRRRGPVRSDRGRRGDHRHAQRHPPADRRGRGPGRQARHVREAAGPERRRGPRDVRGGPRRQGRAHDGVHLPLRPVDALPAAPAQVGRRWARPGISARSGSSTGPRRAGAGGSTRHGPGRATCST